MKMQLEEFNWTGEMTEELAEFFTPKHKIDKVLVAAKTYTERKQMNDWVRKEEECKNKIKQLEEERKLF